MAVTAKKTKQYSEYWLSVLDFLYCKKRKQA